MDFKEWSLKHRKLWIFTLSVLGISLGFLQPILAGSENIFRQGLPFGILYSFVFLATELTYGGKE